MSGGKDLGQDRACPGKDIKYQSCAPLPVSDIQPPFPHSATFYEIAPASGGDCGAAAGFALSIAGKLVQSLRRPVLWVAEDFSLTEQGAPYGPGLAAYGIGLGDFILIRTSSRLDLWRVMEEAIKARAFAAVIGEPATLAGRDLPALVRRLTIAARTHGACTLLLRPPARASFLAPSPLRFEVAARPGSVAEGFPLSRSLPGPPLWSARYRGAPGSHFNFEVAGFDTANFDPDKPFEAGLTIDLSTRFEKKRSRAALPVRISHAA